MNIQYYITNVYGNNLMYLHPNNGAKINESILGLTRRKTLDNKDITCLKNLGFNLTEVLPPKQEQ